MDCCLQLLNNDQLSTSLLEPMLLNKEIIASDIYAYRSLNEKEGLNINLIANQAHIVAKKMQEKD